MKKKPIFWLLVNVAAYSIAANLAHPAEPAFYQELNLPDWTFGAAFACMAFGNFLFAPLWGKLSERRGIVRIMTIGYTGYAIGQWLFLLSKNPVMIMLARLLAGVFTSAVMVNQMLYIFKVEKVEKRGSSLAANATISAVFSAFGYLIGGLLGNIGTHFVLMVQCISLLSIGIVNAFILPEYKEEKQGKITIREVNPFHAFADMRGFMNAVLFLFLITTALTSFASTCYEQCFNYFIRDQYGFAPGMNGLLKGAVGLITLLANSTICIWLMKKTDIFKSIIPVLLICAFMMTGIVFLQKMVPFIILNVVFFAFSAVYKPLLQAMMDVFHIKEGGVLVGAYNSISSLGGVAGSLSAGFAYGISPRFSFVLSATAYFLAAFTALLQSHKMQSAGE